MQGLGISFLTHFFSGDLDWRSYTTMTVITSTPTTAYQSLGNPYTIQYNFTIVIRYYEIGLIHTTLPGFICFVGTNVLWTLMLKSFR